MAGGPLDGYDWAQTPTETLAGRAEVYRIANGLIREAGLIAEVTGDDVLELAQWLGIDF
jgi:hypothetical protein